MTRVAAKFVPKLLNFNQKHIAEEILDSVRYDPYLLQRVITGDASWVYGYDVETKAQSSYWGDKNGIEGGVEQVHKKWFLKCFEDWKKRWHKRIISGGDYFEGDKIYIHE